MPVLWQTAQWRRYWLRPKKGKHKSQKGKTSNVEIGCIAFIPLIKYTKSFYNARQKGPTETPPVKASPGQFEA